MERTPQGDKVESKCLGENLYEVWQDISCGSQVFLSDLQG